MSLSSMLDDAAADATAPLRIDLDAVRTRAEGRRRELRRRAAAAMATAVAVAAALALVALLLPGVNPRTASPAAPVSPTAREGIPDHWYYSPPWTPPVTRHPMPAAAMVVSSSLTTGIAWRTLPGPVLVSADGRRYASLPWGRHDSLVALSRDGRRVAWVTQAGGRPVVHRIELATGRQRDAGLSTDQPVRQLVWAGGDLWLRTDDGEAAYTGSVWRLPATGAAQQVCTCRTPLLATDYAGRVLRPPATTHVAPETGARVTDDLVPGTTATAALADVPADGGSASGVVTGRAVLDTDGSTSVRIAPPDTRSAGAVRLTFSTGTSVNIPGVSEVRNAEVLSWGPDGVLVRIRTPVGRSLRLYAEGGDYRVLSRPAATASEVLAVADEVVGTGLVFPGVRPEFPSTDRSHLRFVVGFAWEKYQQRLGAALAGIVALAVAVTWWRRRRRTDPLGA